MSTAVQSVSPMQPPTKASLPNVIRSEWTKFWSVRSTIWTLVLLVVLTAGFGALICWGVETSAQHGEPQPAGIDATAVSLAGITFSQLAVAVLGVLVISAEYSTGGIRTSLTAVPSRPRLLLAKAIVLGVVSLVVGVITSFVTFFVGQAILGIAGIGTSLGEPGALRAVFGGGLYIFASAMFGFALGTLLRHTAGSITVAVALLFVIPPFLNLLPGEWGKTVREYFTSNAGSQIVSATPQPEALSPWYGYLVFSIWWLAILLVGAWLMNRRDA